MFEAISLGIEDVDLKSGTTRILHLKERPRLYCPHCGSALARTHRFCPGCGVEEWPRIYQCPHCGEVYKERWQHTRCPAAPPEPAAPTVDKGWTDGGQGKVANLRLECRAREERVRTRYTGRLCPG